LTRSKRFDNSISNTTGSAVTSATTGLETMIHFFTATTFAGDPFA